MWLDIINKKIVYNPYPIEGYPSQIWDKENEKLLNILGIYYPTSIDNMPDRRFYTSEIEADYENLTIKYSNKLKDIESIKFYLKSLIVLPDRPRVDTGLGYFVDGSMNDLLNFTMGRDLGVLTIKDADNNFQNISIEDYDTILKSIKENGLRLLQEKWTKEQEIESLTENNINTYLVNNNFL